MANELVKVQFQGDTLDALKDDAGVVWVSLRRCCENLGVSTQGQLKKLKSKAWAVINEKFMTGPDGKAYAVVMLSLESVPMWLATIDARKVEGHVREKLAVYQKRCAAVLAEHFLTRKAAPEPSTDFGRVLGAAIGESMRGAFAETLKAAMLDAMRPAADRLDRVEAAMADLAVRVASPPALPPAVPVFADVNQRVVAAVKEIAEQGVTQEDAAAKYGIATRTVRSGVAVHRDAPALLPLVADGKLNISTAAQVANLSAGEIRRVAAAVHPKAVAKRLLKGSSRRDVPEEPAVVEDATTRHIALAALQATTNNHGFYTVLGYARLLGLEMTSHDAARIGKTISARCAERGIVPARVNDARYGYVNSYPEHVLAEHFGSAPNNRSQT